uniref:Uncharacterized protein n=1 Tax=Cacopsylla melanoneura TaxID=428564 RepID=A0A8D8T1Z4_9HEMI
MSSNTLYFYTLMPVLIVWDWPEGKNQDNSYSLFHICACACRTEGPGAPKFLGVPLGPNPELPTKFHQNRMATVGEKAVLLLRPKMQQVYFSKSISRFFSVVFRI